MRVCLQNEIMSLSFIVKKWRMVQTGLIIGVAAGVNLGLTLR